MDQRALRGAARSALAGIALLFLGSGSVAFAQVQPATPSTSGSSGDTGAQPTVQTSRAYKIRQGDEISVTVFGETAMTPQGSLRVVQGGTITLPLVGPVEIGGLTTSGAAEAIARALHRYLRDPKVSVAVVSVAPIEVLVLGNVKTPGKYTLPPPARLTDVIAAAGDLGTTNGDFPTARLETPEGTTTSVSLQKLLRDGDVTQNVEIESGETVYIPAPSTFTITVEGAVEHPGDVPMHDGDDIVQAVARAGASSAQRPNLNKVAITRTATDGTRTVTVVNLYPILQDGDLSKDIKVQKGDVVFVPTSPNHGVNFGDVFGLLLHFAPY